MGWFDSACDFVSRTATKIRDTAKEIAGKVLKVMADVGEKVVQTVKDVWKKAKPYLEKIQIVAKMVKKIPGVHPWILVAAEAIDRGLTALFALEKSPVLKKIATALEWAIKVARYLSEKFLDEKEMVEAEERKKEFAQAVDSLNDEQRRAVLFGQIVNELLIVRTKLQKLINSNELVNFDHYLRLRATQKLLVDVNQRLNSANELEYITVDDLFLLEVGQGFLAENSNLTDIQLQRLNKLVVERSGKELIPFVFEELVRGWALVLNDDEVLYIKIKNQLSQDEAIFQRLNSHLEFDLSLSTEEKSELEDLLKRLPAQQNAVQALSKSIRQRNHLIDSAEGLLQALEDKVDEVQMSFIPQVGNIIIGCMEKGQEWQQYGEEEQGLIIDFANIFRQARVKRGKQLEEEYNSMILVEVTA